MPISGCSSTSHEYSLAKIAEDRPNNQKIQNLANKYRVKILDAQKVINLVVGTALMVGCAALFVLAHMQYLPLNFELAVALGALGTFINFVNSIFIINACLKIRILNSDIGKFPKLDNEARKAAGFALRNDGDKLDDAKEKKNFPASPKSLPNTQVTAPSTPSRWIDPNIKYQSQSSWLTPTKVADIFSNFVMVMAGH